MQMKVQRLRDVLDMLKPAVPGKKSSLEVLKCVLLKDGWVYAGDLTTMIRVALPEAQGVALLPYREVSALLASIPGHTDLTVLGVEEKKRVKASLLAGETIASYEVPRADSYPPFPELPFPEMKEGKEFSVDGDAFMANLDELSAYAARNDTRVVLNGVTLLMGEKPVMWAGDGFRLAYRPIPGGPLVLEGLRHLIFPLDCVGPLLHVWRRAPKPGTPRGEGFIDRMMPQRLIKVGATEKKARLSFGDVAIAVSLIAGSPPNYEGVIPRDLPHKVTFEAGSLLRAMRGMSPVARESSSIIRLTWEGESLTVSARSGEAGEVRVQVPAEIEGGASHIAFNENYLADYLKDRESFVSLSCSTPSSPAVLEDGGKTRVVMMPMFVQPEKPQPPAGVKGQEEPTGEVNRSAQEGEEAVSTGMAPTAEPEKGKRGRKKKAA